MLYKFAIFSINSSVVSSSKNIAWYTATSGKQLQNSKYRWHQDIQHQQQNGFKMKAQME